MNAVDFANLYIHRNDVTGALRMAPVDTPPDGWHLFADCIGCAHLDRDGIVRQLIAPVINNETRKDARLMANATHRLQIAPSASGNWYTLEYLTPLPDIGPLEDNALEREFSASEIMQRDCSPYWWVRLR